MRLYKNTADYDMYEVWEHVVFGGARVRDFAPFLTLTVEFIDARVWNPMNTDVMFSKKSDEWATPQDFYDKLNAEFVFTLDAAADESNHKTDIWLGPGGVVEDALTGAWPRKQVVWLNPPYSMCREFVKRAALEAVFAYSTVVMLVPSRTDTRWWHENVWDRENHRPYKGVEIRFVKGRLKFGGAAAGAPFPSVVLVFRSPNASQ